MTIVSSALLLLGGAVAILAGVGVVRFPTAFARFHAAGKASPVAFMIAALGAGISLGWHGSALLFLAASATTITLPFGVHLLFRAVERTSHRQAPN